MPDQSEGGKDVSSAKGRVLRDDFPSAPALPKGGGAIRGIDEKFATSSVTGTASFSIPIFTSPGRQGLQPQLGLTYDSGAGNGPFGLGFRLNLAGITRRTDRGLPRYQDGDTFIFIGAEDLVPALRSDASGGWIPDVHVENGIRYDRLRPRVESAYSRIERVTDAAGDVHFRAFTKDNVIHSFGVTSAARIADPSNPSHVFTWLLEMSTDGNGNAIAYGYKAEDEESLPNGVSYERSRPGPQSNRYLKTISYGNRTQGGSDWLFQVVFDYGEHTNNLPTELGAWPCRQDSFSTYRAGFELRTRRLCRRVLMFHLFDPTQPSLVRSTDFTYREAPAISFLSSVTQTGYAQGQPPQSMPSLDLAYTSSPIDSTVQLLEDDGRFHGSVDGPRRFLDLDSEGLPGILEEGATGWFYQRNAGGGTFAPAELIATRAGGAASGAALMDLLGDGDKYLVQLEPAPGGSWKRADLQWEPFLPFRFTPNLASTDPNLRWIDIDGDGLADLLISEDDVFRWYPIAGRDGFGPPTIVHKVSDEEEGPALLFADSTSSIHLADMTGDGLSDIVRTRNGEVCYWPNLGYGRFGAKVTMEAAPAFDRSDLFEASRIRFADVDGSGTTDLIYLGNSGAKLYLNQAGNSLSEPIPIGGFPLMEDVSTVQVADVLGNGTACLVWSSNLPGYSTSPTRYLDLTSGIKPNLLETITDNLGRTIKLQYAPSTKFYLQDLAAGQPWITKLPFPVHVIEQVTTTDHVTGAVFTSRSTYHHGYYDGPEREFRGFGLVETWDAEAYGDADLQVPPIRTRTWFHTGAFQKLQSISNHFAREYWREDATVRLTDSKIPAELSTNEVQEALRSLRGSVLRREIYADDDTAQALLPYLVESHNYDISRLQPMLANPHAVFCVHARESLTCHYERNADDPRIAHQLVLSVDDWGNVLESATVGYPRSTPAYPEQAQLAIVCQEHQFANVADETEWYRVGVPIASRSYQIGGTVPASGALFSVEELKQIIATAGASGSAVTKRLLQSDYRLYYADSLTGSLARGVIESRALPYQQFRAVFGAEILIGDIATRLTTANLQQAQYTLDSDGLWYGRSGIVQYASDQFYLPISFTDPFGNVTTVQYDPNRLVVSSATDALQNQTVAEIDYRVLAPWRVTDPNQNQTAVSFDGLGRVVATAVMGRSGEGDTLAHPTTTIEYQLTRWQTQQLPNRVIARARETHQDPNTKWQESATYYDGLARVVMKKVQAEAGDAPSRNSDGTVGPVQHTDNRWIGTGRVVFNNKGLTIKKYEPFFSSTEEYEDESVLVESGVSPILHYDPLGRLIRTDQPNGTFSTVAFGVWQQTTADENDTVLQSSWFSARESLAATDPQKIAAEATRTHANTPTVAHFDSLGRAFLTIVDNGLAGDGTHLLYSTRVELDIQGRALATIDARQVRIQEQTFNLIGAMIASHSPDAGDRWALNDVLGTPFRSWDGMGNSVTVTRDPLRRPTQTMTTTSDGAIHRTSQTLYGEAHPEALQRNLRGRVFQQYDGAGVVTNLQFDFKGNPLSSTRQLATQYQPRESDWSSLAGADPIAIANSAVPLLDPEVFAGETAFDALNRPVSELAPDGIGSARSEYRYTYNRRAALQTIGARVNGAAVETTFVGDIEYDPKGQRLSIAYQNGATTAYTYERDTFRLSTLTTVDALGRTLQALSYAYDPVGNIIRIADGAQQTVYFRNTIVQPVLSNSYDPIYRLIQASGREHLGQNPAGDQEATPQPVAHPQDASAMVGYVESYQYDAVGNILTLTHRQQPGATWVRNYQYETAPVGGQLVPKSNRLLGTSLPGDAAGSYSLAYPPDGNGNMLALPHLGGIVWNARNEMKEVDLRGGGTVYFTYDAQGQRVRKVREYADSSTEERIYLGKFEVYRETASRQLRLERQTLHVMDGPKRAAMVETKTNDGGIVATPVSQLRYQLDNHLGSACLELDGSALIISYEEYHPYGTSAYFAVDSTIDISAKRYRYTGKERDEETGLSYHGARYYAPWLGRWTSADPIGLKAGPNGFAYVRGNPIRLVDPNGMQDAPHVARPRRTAAQIDLARFRVGHVDEPESMHYHVFTDAHGNRVTAAVETINVVGYPTPEIVGWGPAVRRSDEEAYRWMTQPPGAGGSNVGAIAVVAGGVALIVGLTVAVAQAARGNMAPLEELSEGGAEATLQRVESIIPTVEQVAVEAENAAPAVEQATASATNAQSAAQSTPSIVPAASRVTRSLDWIRGFTFRGLAAERGNLPAGIRGIDRILPQPAGPGTYTAEEIVQTKTRDIETYYQGAGRFAAMLRRDIANLSLMRGETVSLRGYTINIPENVPAVLEVVVPHGAELTEPQMVGLGTLFEYSNFFNIELQVRPH